MLYTIVKQRHFINVTMQMALSNLPLHEHVLWWRGAAVDCAAQVLLPHRSICWVW